MSSSGSKCARGLFIFLLSQHCDAVDSCSRSTNCYVTVKGESVHVCTHHTHTQGYPLAPSSRRGISPWWHSAGRHTSPNKMRKHLQQTIMESWQHTTLSCRLRVTNKHDGPGLWTLRVKNKTSCVFVVRSCFDSGDKISSQWQKDEAVRKLCLHFDFRLCV